MANILALDEHLVPRKRKLDELDSKDVYELTRRCIAECQICKMKEPQGLRPQEQAEWFFDLRKTTCEGQLFISCIKIQY